MWGLQIQKVSNGYVITYAPEEEGSGGRALVLEDMPDDPLAMHESLLYEVMEHFAFMGSKHDPERLRIRREQNKV